MSFSDYWENLIIKHIFNIESGATHDLYVGLSSHDPLDDASGVSEPPGKGYARVKTSLPGGTSWQFTDILTGTTVQNGADITFPEATVDWGTLAYFALFNGKNGGSSLCAFGSLNTATLIEAGDLIKFATGQLKFKEKVVGGEEVDVQGYATGITRTGLLGLYTDRLMASMVASISVATAQLGVEFMWEDTSDFSWADDGGFNWQDT